MTLLGWRLGPSLHPDSNCLGGTRRRESTSDSDEGIYTPSALWTLAPKLQTFRRDQGTPGRSSAL